MQPIYIAGMHRSGTSATTRVLNLLGVDLGSESGMIPAAADNERGFWEQRDIAILNDRLLAEHGGSWSEPPTIDPSWFASANADRWLEEIRDLIARIAGDPKLPFGMKDPRFSFTLPLWQRVSPPRRVVIPIRDPSDVCASLVRRNSMSLEHAARLWVAYVSASIALTPDPVLVDYSRLIQERWVVLDRLCEQLGLDVPTAEVRGSIDSFLTSELDHGPQGQSPDLDEANSLYHSLVPLTQA